ncbi:hypothetical protein ACOSQ4_015424 [Xanthoceras sorbifolium]
MFREAAEYARKCDRCQRTASIPRLPAEDLTPMRAPWPFAQWGLDIIGSLPIGSSQKKYAIMGIDYFTKWIEAEALARITERKATKFVRRSIIYRFGVPEAIITDHGTQFDNRAFRALCQEYKINVCFASPSHPQTNGQGAWVDKLHEVLWALRTTPHTTIGESPFSLAFGTEAVLPTEMTIQTLRVREYTPSDNEVELRAALDELEERRENASIRAAALRQRIERYYNSKPPNEPTEPSSLRFHFWPL